MKKIKIIFPLFLMGMLTSCTNSNRESHLYQMLEASRDSLQYYKYISRNLEGDLRRYEDYMQATETLLDSLGIDEDAPILETDAGAEYLSTVNIIKTLQEEE